MAIAKVKDTGIQSGVNVSSDNALLGTVAAGNFLATAVACYKSSGPTINSIADGIGNSFTQAVISAGFYNGTQNKVAIYYKANCAGGSSTVTITFAAGNYYTAWCAAEFSGVQTSSPLDQTASATGASTATDANVTTPTTTQDSELVLAAASAGVTSSSDVHWGAAPSSGYTNIAQYADFNSANSLSFDFKVVSAIGAQSAAWSHDSTGTSGDGWGAVIATFKGVLTPSLIAANNNSQPNPMQHMKVR